MFYSVPYEYVNGEVEVRITDNLIEVYFNEHRIASHKRLRGDIGQYSTNIDHMPDNHRRYLNHTLKKIYSGQRGLAQILTPTSIIYFLTMLKKKP